jgi:hypothetical protein
MSDVFVANYTSFKNGVLKIQNQNKIQLSHNLNECYELMKMDYPKFFKMDNLSKLVMICCEKLLSVETLHAIDLNSTAIVFTTADGCLETDEKYWASTNNSPSPALFVYTLPNIAVGELSIRYKMKGETATFISENFNVKFQTDYVHLLFQNKKIKACVAGWANFYGGNAEAFFYLALQNQNDLPLNAPNIQNIFEETWKN